MVAGVTPELGEYLERRERLLDDLRGLLVDELRVTLPPDQIDPDTPLFGTGLAFDSIDAVDLVIAIERQLDVRIRDDEMGRLALRSLNMLASYVLAARGQVP
jgi:acyl carrier protein